MIRIKELYNVNIYTRVIEGKLESINDNDIITEDGDLLFSLKENGYLLLASSNDYGIFRISPMTMHLLDITIDDALNELSKFGTIDHGIVEEDESWG